MSLFDLFRVGIGPSSSHTVGPMRAAGRFAAGLGATGQLDDAVRVRIELYGSLALTGKGHGTDRAVLLGLEGHDPERIDPDIVGPRVDQIRAGRVLRLLGRRSVSFDEAEDLLFHRDGLLDAHSNGMRFSAFDQAGQTLDTRVYYSVGGGFVVSPDDPEPAGDQTVRVAHPFESADELLRIAAGHGLTIAEVMARNEQAWRNQAEIRARIDDVWQAMQASVRRGLATEGVLPGGLNVRRRAAALGSALEARRDRPGPAGTAADHLIAIDWLTAYAMAVNEENAAGGRIVTAPTNGAAGVIPSVLHYYSRFIEAASDDGIARFFLTAGAIGLLYKKNASISGAEVGCQGEVGVACSMAAAGLTAALHGTNAQIEQAAEIGMEHHLGMTCDPVAGLVQIPCIERNAVGAVKAVTAARMALAGDGTHKVSLDEVIATMKATGHDMQARYKETSLGGLALTVVEC
jgi:L-serine dehydratase